MPALALLCGGVLALAGREYRDGNAAYARLLVRRASVMVLLPVTVGIAAVSLALAVLLPAAPADTDIASLLTSNPDAYNLSLGHLHDLTLRAMAYFRGPLLGLAFAMIAVGLLPWLLRRRGRDHAANLAMAAGMCGVLLCVHAGLTRFYPILGSRELALRTAAMLRPGDVVVVDGELTSGSTMLFYTRHPVLLVNGRVNGPWFGSFWPDAPPIFPDEAQLHALWAGPRRVFLLTHGPSRASDLARFGAVHLCSSAGGKLLISNR